MKLEYVGDALIVRVEGFLDMRGEKKLKKRVAFLMAEYGIKKVIIEVDS